MFRTDLLSTIRSLNTVFTAIGICHICTISLLYFGKELYMFRTDLLSTIRSLNTVFTATGIYHMTNTSCYE